jgi:ubiquinone/menaquinone biosynthesis C-methylase UbiE
MTMTAPHGMYATPDHDELARESFVRELMVHVTHDLMPLKKVLYETKVKPNFVRANNRPPENRHEIRKAMEEEDFNQVWSALRRTTQEMMFDSIGESVERQLPDLIDRAEGLGSKYGTLKIDSDLEIPRYHTAVDIHCKPGGYHTEITEDDVFAGAEYDRSYNLFAMGASGPKNDDMGRSTARYVTKNYSDLDPKVIVELGCTVGHSTLPFCDEFPDAEVHGIDVAAPCLRYAHARAESMKYTAHFSQQNAEHTKFKDGSVDLIVSHILFHETSNRGLRNILRECHRILRPGGVMVHFEAPQYEHMPDPYDHTLGDWSTHYNAEPFWGSLHDLHLGDLMVEAGFSRSTIFESEKAPSVFLAENPDMRKFSRTPVYPVFGAQK